MARDLKSHMSEPQRSFFYYFDDLRVALTAVHIQQTDRSFSTFGLLAEVSSFEPLWYKVNG